MPNPLHVSIQDPCHENWQQMTPNEQGRHCLACQKTVVDFTQMSDQAILTYLRQTTSGVCGRFSIDQLDRHYGDPAPKHRFNFAYAWSVLVGGWLLTASDVCGQAAKVKQGEVVVSDCKPPKQKKPVRKFNARTLKLGLKDVVNKLEITRVVNTDVWVSGFVVTQERLGPADHISRAFYSLGNWLPFKKNLSFYPNPVQTGTPVQLKTVVFSPGFYKLELMDVAGRIVHVQGLEIAYGVQTFAVPVSTSWSKGLYWARVTQDGRKIQEAKLLIQ